MLNEYVVLMIVGLVLLTTGYFLGKRSARLSVLQQQSTHPEPRFLPKWLYFQAAPDWRAAYWQGLSVEMIGGFIIVIVLTFTLTIVYRTESDRSLKRQLILQMSSWNHDFASEAIRQLTTLGWLYDGSLKGVNLWGANLQDAYLDGADLQGVIMSKNSQYSQRSALVPSLTWSANLENAHLYAVNLEGANLRLVNLRGAFLYEANLKGADLSGAHLEGADLSNVRFDETTILPDGSNWTPDTDMTRFTAPSD